MTDCVEIILSERSHHTIRTTSTTFQLSSQTVKVREVRLLAKRRGERLERLERQKQRWLEELEALAAAQDCLDPTDLDLDFAISGSTPSTSGSAYDPTAEL